MGKAHDGQAAGEEDEVGIARAGAGGNGGRTREPLGAVVVG